MRDALLRFLSVLILAGAAGPVAGQSTRPEAPPAPEGVDEPDRPRLANDPRYGLLTPLPDAGGVPPIVQKLAGWSEEDLAERARVRDYARQIRQIRHKYFRTRLPRLREQGLGELREFTDPAAFRPMVEVLRGDEDDVRLALLDHLARQGDHGQAALAWVSVHDEDPALRNEATMRMVSPVSPPVLAVLDGALRDPDHVLASNAGALAGALNVVETIPLLINAQISRTARGGTGDLAWIAVQKQTVYVERLEAVVGDGSGAFVPIVNTLNEGFVLRVLDAVVIVYRTVIHNALVAMTTQDWGEPTGDMGYDRTAWVDWYNNQYLPYKNEQAIIDELAEEPG